MFRENLYIGKVFITVIKKLKITKKVTQKILDPTFVLYVIKLQLLLSHFINFANVIKNHKNQGYMKNALKIKISKGGKSISRTK